MAIISIHRSLGAYEDADILSNYFESGVNNFVDQSDFAVEWVALLLRIREISGSSLGSEILRGLP